MHRESVYGSPCDYAYVLAVVGLKRETQMVKVSAGQHPVRQQHTPDWPSCTIKLHLPQMASVDVFMCTLARRVIHS